LLQALRALYSAGPDTACADALTALEHLALAGTAPGRDGDVMDSQIVGKIRLAATARQLNT
jgi:hypothetical protein